MLTPKWNFLWEIKEKEMLSSGLKKVGCAKYFALLQKLYIVAGNWMLSHKRK